MAAFQYPDVPGTIAYLRPSHASPGSPPMMFKTPSYEKGFYPEHLKKYAGQAAYAPKACKGKGGQAYRRCLVSQTAKLKKG